jgi:hypothetical protein
MPVPLIDLPPRCCKAVVVDPQNGKPAMMCAEPVVNGLNRAPSSWCRTHYDTYVIVRKMGTKSVIADGFDYSPAVHKAKARARREKDKQRKAA